MTTEQAPEAVLSIRNLSIAFSHPRPAVVDVSLDLHRGELLALVGESGSGKSMTARSVLGLLPPGATSNGSITLDGEEILNAEESTLEDIRGGRVGLIFQEPQSALNPVRTIGWQLVEAVRAHHDLDKRTARARAAELLDTVDIPDPEDRLDSYPHQLSGGQRQRVAIALALAGDPDVLLADEPTTALDVTVQAGILNLLDRLREERDLTILLITHDMGVVAENADRVIVLRYGEVVEEGPTRRIIDHPEAPYTKELIAAVPRFAEVEAAEQDAEADDASEDVDDRQPAPAAAVSNVTVIYGSGRRTSANLAPAVDKVSLSVAPGATLGLVGESGSGKSTLGRVLAGIQEPTIGHVTVSGLDLASLPRQKRRALQRSVAVVQQDPVAALNPRKSIGWSIREPLDIHKVGTRESRKRHVDDLLRAVHLPPEFALRSPAELSGGQRQRVALARALALDPSLVIADEPTSALDVSVQADVIDLLRDTQAELNFAMVFISHDLAVVSEVSDTVAVLRRGRLVEYGPTEDVFTDPRETYTRDLLDAVPVLDEENNHPHDDKRRNRRTNQKSEVAA
ncbi:MAG TPA: ABC transporter ATP-binding protein [Candidatus Corynebacterium avicola]|uniref:ABC transporter ATP-binding protein n=1 Tax=Candidatus Corynebacterium avicola TaxID=2838527 RepID=A0A9D1RQU5_9CORY|nr:ABC transporter ATP-binding protein [Candidatus Corynebacterium avicola]